MLLAALLDLGPADQSVIGRTPGGTWAWRAGTRLDQPRQRRSAGLRGLHLQVAGP
jgi:hypothetical protein